METCLLDQFARLLTLKNQGKRGTQVERIDLKSQCSACMEPAETCRIQNEEAGPLSVCFTRGGSEATKHYQTRRQESWLAPRVARLPPCPAVLCCSSLRRYSWDGHRRAAPHGSAGHTLGGGFAQSLLLSFVILTLMMRPVKWF